MQIKHFTIVKSNRNRCTKMPRSTSIVSSLVRSAPRPAVRAPTYIHGPTRRTVSTSTSAAPAGGAASSGSAASNGGSAAAEAGTALPSHWFHKHNYPLFALAVGISALCFQIKILVRIRTICSANVMPRPSNAITMHTCSTHGTRSCLTSSRASRYSLDTSYRTYFYSQ
jgi:hypothetical protein